MSHGDPPGIGVSMRSRRAGARILVRRNVHQTKERRRKWLPSGRRRGGGAPAPRDRKRPSQSLGPCAEADDVGVGETAFSLPAVASELGCADDAYLAG